MILHVLFLHDSQRENLSDRSYFNIGDMESYSENTVSSMTYLVLETLGEKTLSNMTYCKTSKNSLHPMFMFFTKEEQICENYI